MKPVIPDFVNRTDHLTFLWKIANKRVKPRIWVIEGYEGIGKTYLLKEFRAECQEKGFEVVFLDFAEKYGDPSYLYVIREIRNQLGWERFDHLTQTIENVAAGDKSRQVQELLQNFTARENDPALTTPTAHPTDREIPESQPFAGRVENKNQSGGVNFFGGINTVRDVAGRDINYLIQIIYKEDQYVQDWAREKITTALGECLGHLSPENKIILFLDHWNEADSDLRKWLASSIIKWTADLLLTPICVLIAGDQVELEPRLYIHRDTLLEWTDDAIYTYLVKINGIPKEELPDFKSAGGWPSLLYGSIKRRNLKIGQRSR